MANPFLNTVQLASGFLNDENNPVVGKSVNPDSLPALEYRGLLGKILVIDDAQALKLSKLATGTLRAGAYMCVITKAGSTAAPARGIGAFWDTLANNGLGKYTVTPDIAATSAGQMAGVYLNAPTKGNQTWIQIAGLATLLCTNPVAANPAIGDVAVLEALTTNTFDHVADGTDYFATAGAYKLAVGTWYELPADGGLKLAWLKSPAMTPYFLV